MEEQWVNDLRKKMASHQTPVPPGLWEGIEAGLKNGTAKGRVSHKKVRLWTTVVCGIAAVMAVGFFLFTENAGKQAEEMATSLENLTFSTTTIAEGEASVPKVLALNAAPSALSAPAIQEKSLPQPKEAEIPRVVTQKTITIQEEKKTSRQTDFHHSEKQSQRMEETTILPTTVRKSRRLTLQCFASNLPSTSHQYGGYGELVSGSILPQHLKGQTSSTSPFAREIVESNLGKEVYTETKHRMPVRLGISARYHLNSRLSIESGLTYNFLSSELTSGSETHHYVTDQQLHYIGLPLSFSYDLWKRRRWEVYATAGGMLEKCVYGKQKTSYVLGGKEQPSQQSHIMDKPIQCSVVGALGAQFLISPYLALYAEPGMSYYFDNGSEVDNIFKDKPFNFNFKLGFRFILN